MRKIFLRLTLAAFFLLPCVFSFADSWREFAGSEKTAILDSVGDMPATFYVSPEGNDTWSGKISAPNTEASDGPFRSFERAQKAVQEYRTSADFGGGATVVEVLPGTYELEKALTFKAADSGTPGSPVVWRGTRGKNGEPLALLRGGRTLTGAKPASDPAALKRIKPELRGKILAFDMEALGIDNFGTLNGKDTAELFFNNQPMTLSRYPNEGFIRFDEVVRENNPEVDIRGMKGVKEPKIFQNDYDMTPWLDEPEIWTLGYWFFDWSNEREKIVKIDLDRKVIELSEPYDHYGYRTGQYYYVYNLLCELDVPGEYYIDRASKTLYFYPPEEVTDGSVFFSILKNDVLLSDVHDFVFCGFLLDGCRGTALAAKDSEDSIICSCLVRNAGGAGIRCSGKRNLIFGNHLYNLGAEGISFSGGDRKTITHGGSAAVNNDVHHYGRIKRVYAAGIGFDDCGNLIARNRITDAPHNAILFGGTEMRIEGNEIARVCEESNDAGAIYCGCDWTERGNVIKNNYLHDISGFEGRGCVGVYLDDMFSSADIVGNIFVNVTQAAFIGGGRDNSIVNNIFVDCHPSIHVDARALGWAYETADRWLKEIEEKGTLNGKDFKSEPWSGKYPKLAAILEGTPKAPEGNLIARNIVVYNSHEPLVPTCFEGDSIEKAAREYLDIRDNVVGDYRLLLSVSQAPKSRIPATDAEFERIPVEEIGCFEHPAAISR